jgi:hypothetical protein
VTDQYEEVAAADLNEGDEAEIVFRGVVNGFGNICPPKSTYAFGNDFYKVAHAIRHKVRPISVGDRVVGGGGKYEGEVLCAHREWAWVAWSNGSSTVPRLSALTRIPPEPVVKGGA